MEKHFVTYNQALALKELEFDEPCLARFFKVGDEKEIFIYFNTPSNENTDVTVITPLKSQVFEWFRGKHNLYSEIRTFVWDYDKKELGFSVRTYLNPIDIETERLIHPEVYETYEEAESACIDKLIEIIKNK